MSQQYDDTNRGALFKNARKETDNHPDYRGNINVNGQDFWLSAWLKKSKDGKAYMSLSVQPKDQSQQQSAPQQAAPQQGGYDEDLDVPF